jgi:hypothetical protein
LRELVTVAAPLLAIATALIYGILVLAYSEFHAELGVRAVDAGVNYGPGLGGTARIVALIASLSVVLTAISIAVWWTFRRITSPSHPQLDDVDSDPVSADEGHPPHQVEGVGESATAERAGRRPAVSDVAKPVIATGAVWVCLIALALAIFLIEGANNRADAVKRGKPLEPLRVFGVELLSIRADVAGVEILRLSEAGAQMAPLPEHDQILADLRERDPATDRALFYLGRSTASSVLYDSQTQRVLYIPNALVVVRSYNCETRYRNEWCDDVVDRPPPPERQD